MNGYSPGELKTLSLNKAQALAEEIRRFLVEHVTLTGGHLASNLGIVEISLALLRVFSPPEDSILYDTGHQSYVHKLLTGRLDEFETLRQYGGISGFPRRGESEYDAFGAGHSGTAISAAIGLSRARALTGKGQGQHTVAVIGDGALANGMVYEALNNLKKSDNLIIVLNDNKMSISKSVGTLARYLNRIRTREGYFTLKHKSHDALSRLPFLGRSVDRALSVLKGEMKALVYRNNLFEQLGVYYLGPGDGNNLAETQLLLREARRHSGPVLVHLITKKGKGYAPAEQHPDRYHSLGVRGVCGEAESFSTHFGKKLTALARRDPGIVAVTAAMCEGTGLTPFRRYFPQRFFDVGIAEEHGMTFCAGLSAGGLKPVFAVYSTFFQRAYDQLFHDIALQRVGALICLDRAGFAEGDGPTHHGLFDVALCLHLPGVVIDSPATYAEQERLLADALSDDFSQVRVLRYPKGKEKKELAARFSCREEMELLRLSGAPVRVLLLSYGRICANALSAADTLSARGISCAVLKFTRLKPLNAALFEELTAALSEAEICYCLEEGAVRGGFFAELFRQMEDGGLPQLPGKIVLRAVEDRYVPQGSFDALCRHCGMTPAQISEEILWNLEK